MAERAGGLNARSILLAAIPAILLGVVIYAMLTAGPESLFATDLPPVEDISILRHTLAEDLIRLDVIALRLFILGLEKDNALARQRATRALYGVFINAP